MGICAWGDVLQEKVYNLLGDIVDVKTYIHDILISSNGIFSNGIYQIIVIFDRLRDSGLILNVPRWSFGIKEITYLVYVITWEGIKTDTKKLQGIMDLGRTNTNTETWALIGMIEYYRDLCPRQYHVLDPTKDEVRRPKCRKIIWNEALEESFKEIKRMVSSETLLKYLGWKYDLYVHTYDSDKYLGSVIIQYNQPMDFSRGIRNTQQN